MGLGKLLLCCCCSPKSTNVVHANPTKGKGDATTDAKSPTDGNRNLSDSFVEHRQSIEQLAQAYPQSNIDVEEPRRSGGLSSSTAAQLLLVRR
jgi:hypothetical protein